MRKRNFLFVLLFLSLVLVACAEQEQQDLPLTELPPEPETASAEIPEIETSPTESPDSVLPAGAGPPLMTDQLTGILWHWQDLVEVDPAAQSDVPDPENYSVVFLEDKTLAIQADCNDVAGSYLLDAGQLRIILGPSTMAICGDESTDIQFLNLLAKATSGTVENGRLKLYTSDGATMDFTAGGEKPGSIGITPEDIALDVTGVAESWQSFVVPDTHYDASMPPGPVGLPEHIEIHFDGSTPDTREFFAPIMYIIPVTAYEEMWEMNDSDAVTRIMNQIAAMTHEIPEPAPTSGMPVLPVEEVGTAYNDLAVHVGRVAATPESASKNGYRFIGRWNQDANSVTNQGLRYVYQGFTNDGAYLVSYWQPVRTDALPDTPADLSQEAADSFTADPSGHINSQAQNPNGLNASDWEPDLAKLDALVASLQIAGMVSSGMQETTWAWTGRSAQDNVAQPVSDPTQYIVAYHGDGSFNYQANCIAGGGSYSVIGGFEGLIQHALGPTTRTMCAPQTLTDEFLGALRAAEEFRLLPGGHQMQLQLPASGPVLTFSHGEFVDVDIPEPEVGVPAPSPVPPPSVSISFTADDTTLNKGDCTNLRWNVENIQAIWVYPVGLNYLDFPQVGHGLQQVCPVQTTTYEMRVQHVDGLIEIRSITTEVKQTNTIADTSWSVSSLYGNQLPLPGSSMTLQFEGESYVTVNGGCNSFSGPYAAYFSGISIGPLAGTRVACGNDLDAQETTYLKALESAVTYSQSGDQLLLFNSAKAEVARFIALRAVPLDD